MSSHIYNGYSFRVYSLLFPIPFLQYQGLRWAIPAPKIGYVLVPTRKNELLWAIQVN